MPDHITALSNLRIGVEMDKHHMDDGEEKLAALDAAIAALRAQPAAATAENIREGDPYDDPAFEELAREHDVWGRASSALCAVFWRAGKTAGATVPDDEWEAFEAWAKPRHYWLERMAAAPDQYSNTETQNVFACWKARAALAASAAPQEPIDYKAMFQQAVASLAAISEALGIPDDEAATGEPAIIIDYIRELKHERDEWADAGYAVAAEAQELAGQDDKAQEAAEIIENLITNIESHGMYSQESTLGFLTQAFYCLRPANAASAAPQAGEDAQPVAYRWRRHGRDDWHYADWIPISDEETAEMERRDWDVLRLYATPQPAPQAAAAVPESRNE